MREARLDAAATVPLSLGVQGLARLWDRRAAEATEIAAAEAYHRAAAEAQEVIRALAPAPIGLPDPALPEQHELGI
jgi:hypothetical protein